MPPTSASGTGSAEGRHQLGARHRREAGHGADREIELAADEQDRLADGDDADRGETTRRMARMFRSDRKAGSRT